MKKFLTKNFSFNIAYLLILFVLIFVVPHILEFYFIGVNLSADNIGLNKSNLKSLSEIIFYLENNLYKNLNLIENQIFIFFIVAYIYQKLFLFFRK